MSERRYPIPAPDDDPRFTFGLVVEVAEVLQRHGFPAIGPDNSDDLVELSQALFRFVYSDQGRVYPPDTTGGA